jgi:Protein of unknown function (DUF1822)
LALCGFEHWLAYQGNDITFNHSQCSLWQSQDLSIPAICNVMAGQFCLCLLTNNSLIPDMITVPRVVMESSAFAAHLYVGLEVLGEEVIWRGFLRANQLVQYFKQADALPFSYFETAPEQFCYCLRLLKPSDLALKLASDYAIAPSLNNLSQWGNQIFAANWRSWQPVLRTAGVRFSEPEQSQLIEPTALIELIKGAQQDEMLWSAIEQLWQIYPEHSAAGVKRVKTLTLKVSHQELQLELLVAIVHRLKHKIHVLLRIYPDSDQHYLPRWLNILLLDEHQNCLKVVTTREQDFFVQLMLSGQQGERFGLKVLYQEAEVTEAFVL